MRIPFTLMTAFTSTLSGSGSGFTDMGHRIQRLRLMRFLFAPPATLPAASFRFHLAMDTLAVGLVVPVIDL
jgi:hypothetical protein